MDNKDSSRRYNFVAWFKGQCLHGALLQSISAVGHSDSESWEHSTSCSQDVIDIRLGLMLHGVN